MDGEKPWPLDRAVWRIISARYGAMLPNNRAGIEILCIVGHHIVHLGSDAERHIVAWARFWAPWMPPQRVAEAAAGIIARPWKFSADTLGFRLRLSNVERQSLGITTIGAFDLVKVERERLRKIKRAGADLERRRQKGAISRAKYEARSLAKTQPWLKFGMSRSTWYRHGMPRVP